MNSMRESLPDLKGDPLLRSLMEEAQANIRARNPEAPAAAELPKHLFEGPKYDGKQCAVCERHFKASSEFLTCKLCQKLVCRRKGTCKGVHAGLHRVAFNKAAKKAKEDSPICPGNVSAAVAESSSKARLDSAEEPTVERTRTSASATTENEPSPPHASSSAGCQGASAANATAAASESADGQQQQKKNDTEAA